MTREVVEIGFLLDQLDVNGNGCEEIIVKSSRGYRAMGDYEVIIGC